ncbi:PIN2/TERF1-interacting telomerase inhibitor 1 [Parambassis ranga]|uniref:PIN2/TERF1-interacting telomerase inhibitor 1 n=1 Tax=Parambassis ranga TaxID=210632 RepID=A0A6P7HEE9_9TELE|nr:PIN2/TERF1-interacting telomerase inhibitor 1 [Parambassis ranga]
MSMLAEPRRKQKWSVDPRNSAWSKDESKFGQKMLERMGWSKGKGLGRTEQGSTDHIKVKLKNNSYGLGANASHEDKWISHQDDFNDLLAQLNNCHGQNNSSGETPTDEQKGFSLEEKSKTSRKRVHYMKFTKGKDLSSRSETDLNCIFGKRAKSETKDQEQESNSSDSQGEAEENGTPELDTESATKTVTSNLTMQEYFAQRMAQLKKSRGVQKTESSVEAETTETSGPSDEVSPVHSNSDDTKEPEKKKKKKKKNKKAVDEVGVEEEEETCSAPILEDTEEKQEEERSKKKKKKRKMAENTDAAVDNSCSTSGLEPDCEELPLSKKKKPKKHKDSELVNGHETNETQTVESEDERKKKHTEDVDSEVKDEEKKSKKKKKKKKKHHE